MLLIYIDAGSIYIAAGRNTSDSTSSHPGTLVGNGILVSLSD